MLTKMISAVMGGKLAKNANMNIGGPTGAAIGAAVPFIISRMSIPAMIAMGVGGYAVKKYMERKDDTPSDTAATNTAMKPAKPASIPQPATA